MSDTSRKKQKAQEIFSLIQDGKLSDALEDFYHYTFTESYQGLSDKRRNQLCQAIIDAIEQHPPASDNKIVHRIKSLAYRGINDFNSQIAILDKLIQEDPENGRNFYELAGAKRELGQIAEAAENYELSFKKGYRNVWALLRAADAHIELSESEQAEAAYNLAIRFDPEYAWSYFLFGGFLYNASRLEEAHEKFETVLRLSQSTSYVRARAKEEVEKIVDQKKAIIKRDFVAQIQDILNTLRYEGNRVAHYSSVSALRVLVLESSEFRLSEASFLNDPSEGEIFWKFLSTACQQSIRTRWARNGPATKLRRFEKKPFVGSFVEGTLSNSLLLWRIYGKQSGLEAAGCCLVFQRAEVENQLRAKINSLIDSTAQGESTSEVGPKDLEDASAFYRVAYIGEDGSFHTGEGPKKDKLLQQKISRLVTSINKDELDDSFLSSQIARISCLFKDSEYMEEREIRIVLSPTGISPSFDDVQSPPRVFYPIGKVDESLVEVIFGPKTQYRAELAARLHYHFEENELNVEVFSSELEFR